MSVENRKAMYDKLVKEGRLSQDDGALEKEFGKAPTAKEPVEKPEKPEEKPKEELKKPKKKGKR